MLGAKLPRSPLLDKDLCTPLAWCQTKGEVSPGLCPGITPYVQMLVLFYVSYSPFAPVIFSWGTVLYRPDHSLTCLMASRFEFAKLESGDQEVGREKSGGVPSTLPPAGA